MVTRNYWWPGVTKDIQRYVEACTKCETSTKDGKMSQGNKGPSSLCYDLCGWIPISAAILVYVLPMISPTLFVLSFS